MLKVELIKYPIDIDRIDTLIIFMIYHQLNSLEVLLSKTKEELVKLDGWREELGLTIDIILSNYPLD